jgi:hypothetical protein
MKIAIGKGSKKLFNFEAGLLTRILPNAEDKTAKELSLIAKGEESEQLQEFIKRKLVEKKKQVSFKITRGAGYK